MNEAASPRVRLPARTATFLFTDIEGSTRLWEEHREAMSESLEAHDALLRSAVERAGGNVVKTTGDGMLAAFDRAESAMTAALDGEVALADHAWATPSPLRVRMAIHSGTADTRDGDFFGPALNRVARLLAIGHGGQVLVSGTTAGLVADDLPPGAELIDLGEHRLRDLDRPEHVFQLVAAPLRRDFPPLRSGTSHTTNLPLQVTSFVGRERELADIERLLSTGRMVTLVGVGGTGKTRLALQAAAEVVERYPGGAWLVELAPLTDASLVATEVARALRVQPQPGQPPLETLVDYLRSKHLLLLIDNCEHLIGAAADVAHHLLGRCAELSLLASSREPLGIDAEAVYAVPSLGLPTSLEEAGAHAAASDEELEQAGRSEAVCLFAERAAATLPSFALDRSNMLAVVEICRRLDGIPLALELAAARVNVLSVAEIAQGLGDRFRLLTGGRRTALPRQRTLQALIDWSWDLLDDDDRRLLRRLSVFAGGWALEAAASVTSERAEGTSAATDGAAARFATLDGLGRLVDRSLVAVDHHDTTRYRMLETIRQYAADQLAASGETIALRDRHLATFRQLTIEAGKGLDGPDMATWLARIDTEIDNVRGALDWALETDPEAALEMCVSMARYWRSRNMGSEAPDRMRFSIDRVRALSEPVSPVAAHTRGVLLARAFAVYGVIAVGAGRSDAAAVAEEAVRISREAGDGARHRRRPRDLRELQGAVRRRRGCRYLALDGPRGAGDRDGARRCDPHRPGTGRAGLSRGVGRSRRGGRVAGAGRRIRPPVRQPPGDRVPQPGPRAHRRSLRPPRRGAALVPAVAGAVPCHRRPPVRTVGPERARPRPPSVRGDRRCGDGVPPDDPRLAAQREPRSGREPTRIHGFPRHRSRQG